MQPDQTTSKEGAPEGADDGTLRTFDAYLRAKLAESEENQTQAIGQGDDEYNVQTSAEIETLNASIMEYARRKEGAPHGATDQKPNNPGEIGKTNLSEGAHSQKGGTFHTFEHGSSREEKLLQLFGQDQRGAHAEISRLLYRKPMDWEILCEYELGTLRGIALSIAAVNLTHPAPF